MVNRSVILLNFKWQNLRFDKLLLLINYCLKIRDLYSKSLNGDTAFVKCKPETD